MKTLRTLSVLICLLLFAGACAQKAAEQSDKTMGKAQTTCPVMGGKIDKTQFVDVKGKRIYVCCPDCVKAVKADPDKYIKKLEDSGVTLAKTPEQ